MNRASKKIALALGIAAVLTAVTPMLAFADTTASHPATSSHSWDRNRDNDRDRNGDHDRNNHNNNDRNWNWNRNGWNDWNRQNRWHRPLFSARQTTIAGTVASVEGNFIVVEGNNGLTYFVNAANARVRGAGMPYGIDVDDRVIVSGFLRGADMIAVTITDLPGFPY